MLNQDKLKQLASENDTASAIFDHLSKRRRFRDKTNLIKFKYDLIHDGKKVDADEYISTFKRLHELGVGSLIVGRRGKPNRFIWNFNLKDVGKAVNEPSNEPIKELKTKKGRKPRLATVQDFSIQNPVTLTISLPRTVRSEDFAALLGIINDLGMNK